MHQTVCMHAASGVDDVALHGRAHLLVYYNRCNSRSREETSGATLSAIKVHGD